MRCFVCDHSTECLDFALRSFSVVSDLQRIPCLSTEFCLDPPSVGDDITVTTVPVGEDWQRNLTNIKCDKPEHFLFVSDIDYPGDTDVECVTNTLFGGIFPYWDIPGLDYPSVTKLYCVNAMQCQDYSDLVDRMDPLGLMDNFDQKTWMVGDTFQLFCSMDGKGGW